MRRLRLGAMAKEVNRIRKNLRVGEIKHTEIERDTESHLQNREPNGLVGEGEGSSLLVEE